MNKNDAAKAAFVLLKKVEKKKPNMTSTFENMRRRDLQIMDDGVHHSQDVNIVFEVLVYVFLYILAVSLENYR